MFAFFGCLFTVCSLSLLLRNLVNVPFPREQAYLAPGGWGWGFPRQAQSVHSLNLIVVPMFSTASFSFFHPGFGNNHTQLISERMNMWTGRLL